MLASQVVFTLLGAIVVGFLMIMGAKWYIAISENVGEIDYTNFERELARKASSNLMKDNTDSSGVVAPSGVERVCFASFDESVVRQPSFSDAENRILADSVGDTTDNVFVFTSGGRMDRFRVDLIAPEDDGAVPPANPTNENPCFSVTKGRLNVKFTGKGKWVSVDNP